MKGDMANMTSLRSGLGVLVLALAAGFPSGGLLGADYEQGTPSTYLFDTGAPSPKPLDGTRLAPRSGWTLVPEDDLTHPFRGDAVVLNDRLVLAIRRGGVGAEVYGVAEPSPRQRAVLVPLAASGGRPNSLQTVRIIENNLGAVLLAATYRTPEGGSCAVQFRLTAGQMIAETRPGAGVDRLLVDCPARYIVVPDFFGDDMVFGPRAATRPRLRLPAENFCLGLTAEDRTQVMCVWQSGQQQAVAVAANSGLPGSEPDPTRSSAAAAFAGWEVQAARDKSVWVACLEGERLWHERTCAAGDAGTAATLDWQPPFAAKWRADLLQSDGAAESWFFDDPDASPEDQAVAKAVAARHACCFEAGRAVVRWSGTGTAAAGSSLLVYALDRNRETPLATFCPVDVLRNTLGVGPCEYILQTEGLATETNPTPNNAMTWVEKQFGRNRQKKAADEIQELLGQMVVHVEHTQARIERYGKFAQEFEALLGQRRLDPPGLSQVAALRAIAAGIAQDAAAFSRRTPPPAQLARQLADRVAGLIDRENSAAQCEQVGAELRALGASGDRALAQCRMACRWLQQSAAMLAEDTPAQAALAGEVQARVRQVLEAK